MELTWIVNHVVAAGHDPDRGFQPFAYSEGLWAEEGVPNLYLPHVGACDHVVGHQVANAMVNEVAMRLVADEVQVGDAVDVRTGVGAILRMVLGAPLTVAESRLLDVFPRDPGPVIPLSWTCSLDPVWPT